MKIASEQIPIAPGHEPAVVFSNIIYVLVAAALLVVAGWPSYPVAVWLIVQGLGSSLFHATTDEARWAQVLDSIAIQQVLASLLALVVAVALSIKWWGPALALPAVWAGWWVYGHRVDRIPATIVQGTLILGAVMITAPWWQTTITGGAIAVAAALWTTGRTHGLRHSLWHVSSGIAQASAAWWLILLLP